MSDDLKKILIDHVADPDKENEKDTVKTFKESCKYENRDIDLDECIKLVQRRDELERSYIECVRMYGDKHDECRKLKTELDNIRKNLKIERKFNQEPHYTKHHEGLNILAYRYYFVNAVRCYMLCQKEEAMKHLARALHYVQDAPLEKKPRSKSFVEDRIVIGGEDYHDELEDEVNNLWRSHRDALVNEFKRRVEELELYVNKEGAEYELTKPVANHAEILRRALCGTYVVLRKFEQSISRLSKDMEKLRKTYHTLKTVTRVSYAILFIGILVLVLASAYPSLEGGAVAQLGICAILLSIIGFASSNLLFENKRLTFYMASLVEEPPESLTKEVRRERKKVIEYTLVPSLPPCKTRQPVCS